MGFAVSFHVTLFAVNFLVLAEASSSRSSDDGLTEDARRDQRVGARVDVAAAKTAATVLGRRESRPLPSARAMMDRERDGRRSGSVAATTSTTTFDCASLSLTVTSAVHNE